MLTKEFIGLIAQASELKKKDVETLMSTMTAVVRESLMSGKTIQLQGLGALEVKERKERVIVHPKTGERTVVGAKNQVVFKPVSNIKSELKNS